jgi:hypothetical protein
MTSQYEYGFKGYPFGGFELYGDVEGLGQAPTPNVPVVVIPAPVSLTQQITNFLRSPFGIMALVASGLFIANWLGYIDLRKMFEITSEKTRRRRTY